MLQNWNLTHCQMEQYLDLESGSLNSLSNDMSPLIGSPDPGAQARLQVDEMGAQAVATVLAKAATNGRNRVDKKIAAAKNKVRRSWFAPGRTTSDSS
jgi:hypothetical protein